ncbi:MAG TPA: MBL fold metallo-hydrolase [Ktedonobacteraceae bacterium]|jgi:glyoxylase-like metal-dependent hydrolase (beta-lactamase superfamily II)
MQLIQLQENVWVIQGGANIGVIAHEGRCLLIDSGMDKDAGRDILKQVQKLGLVPDALVVTHAHADHFGGAHYLVRQTGLKVYATRVEASVMAGPILEPLYLFSGAQPPRELQHKFLLAKPCITDVVLTGTEQNIAEIPVEVIPLPGHSLEQVGVIYGETLFAGDAFLASDILDKHGIPFYTDIQMGLASLDQLSTRLDGSPMTVSAEDMPEQARVPKMANQAFKHIVAGHGEIYTSPEQAKRVIQYTTQRLESILELARGALADGVARPGSDVLQVVTRALGVDISTLSQYVLCNTTVQAALSALYARDEVCPLIRENNLIWQRKNAV